MVGPYFFENDVGTTAAVNSVRYGHKIIDFVLPAIKEYKLENMWFLQKGSKCHTRANMTLFEETFPGRVISHRGDINWSPRSCDLTPLDFFCVATQKTVLVQLNLQLLSI